MRECETLLRVAQDKLGKVAAKRLAASVDWVFHLSPLESATSEEQLDFGRIRITGSDRGADVYLVGGTPLPILSVVQIGERWYLDPENCGRDISSSEHIDWYVSAFASVQKFAEHTRRAICAGDITQANYEAKLSIAGGGLKQ